MNILKSRHWPLWIAAILTLATAGAVLLGTGITKVVGWYVVLAYPLLGLMFILGTVGTAIWSKRISLPIVIGFLFGLVYLLPIVWLPMLDIWPVGYPVNVEGEHPQLRIRVPTSEPMLVINGGPDARGNVHAFLPPQAWAFDLLIEPHTGVELEDFGCYGVSVVAPTSGTIVHTHDGDPDVEPGQIAVSRNAYGNHVVIHPEQGGYLVVAHFRNGTVQHRAGDLVTEGDFIGNCGNSGNTSSPHVHVHYQRQDPREHQLLAEPLPLRFHQQSGPSLPTRGQVVAYIEPAQ